MNKTEKAETLGQFEQLVLTAVHSLGKEAYGVPIHAKVSEMSGKDVNTGSIYVTLDRLSEKGMLSSSFSDPIPERGGKPRRFYRLEAAGQRALQDALETARRMAEVIEESPWKLGKFRPKRQKT